MRHGEENRKERQGEREGRRRGEMMIRNKKMRQGVENIEKRQ